MSGKDLAAKLSRLGYEEVRQSGSHIRLSRSEAPAHRVTVPAHENLRIGTLAAILDSVAGNLSLTRDQALSILLR